MYILCDSVRLQVIGADLLQLELIVGEYMFNVGIWRLISGY